MTTAARRSLTAGEYAREEIPSTVIPQGKVQLANSRRAGNAAALKPRVRVYVAAENRLLREALAKVLMRRGDIEVVGLNSGGEPSPQSLLDANADLLLLTSHGSLAEDVPIIRRVRSEAPHVKVLLAGMAEDETDFFQYVRAGIAGYLSRDASAEDVLQSIQAVHEGEAVCPGSLCARLFHFFEREAACHPSFALRERLGLTRREQQILPLLAQGLTNKEIANHFHLSEQTIKNHLHRMKHKIGAGDRLQIVHLCRTHGFLV